MNTKEIAVYLYLLSQMANAKHHPHSISGMKLKNFSIADSMKVKS